MTIFITGGAGSIGSVLVRKLFNRGGGEKMIIFDSNEHGLFNLKTELGTDNIEYILGTLKERNRIVQAMPPECDVIHLASLKNIYMTEQNPHETIYSNIIGTLNLIEIAQQKQAKKFLVFSSDKSVDFKSIYGATKFLQEKITLWANKRGYDGAYSVFRSGNVKETAGNVFEIWRKQKERGEPLTLTDPNMKRYFIGVEDVTNYLIKAFDIMHGGELFVPPMDEIKMLDLAEGMSDKIKTIGLREGEKLEEDIMTDDEWNRHVIRDKLLVVEAK